MFKAYHILHNQDVISIDPAHAVEQLRIWTGEGHLVCPGCKSPVDYRRAGVRRAHFSHRANADCHYSAGDPEVIAARGALYAFLAAKVRAKGGRIDAEVRLPGAPEGDLVDVWVELPGCSPIAYRIFKSGRRPAHLSSLEEATQQAGASTRFLLTISRRRFANPEDEGRREFPPLHIPSLDRHLSYWRGWDRYHVLTLEEPRPYRSLVYIDPDEERLYFYRDLSRPGDCNPSTFDYVKAHEAGLSDLRIHKGDLIFPDELGVKERWEKWAVRERERRQQQAIAEAQRLKELKERDDWRRKQRTNQNRLQVRPTLVTTRIPQPIPTVKPGPRPRPSVAVGEELLCTTCGQRTRDWWTRYRPGEGECRACSFRRAGLDLQVCASCKSAFPSASALVDGLCSSCR